MDEKKILSVGELAKYLGISRPKAYDLAHRSDFPTIKLGKRILVPIKQLEAWLEKQTEAAT